MATPLPYDPADPQSILQHARGLLKKSLRQVLGDGVEQTAASMRGKGDFGQLVEKLYFLYEPNSNAEPDLMQSGLNKCIMQRQLQSVRGITALEFQKSKRVIP